jgi:hypothetical protein
VADEVIDLFLPVLFYWVRRRRWERLHAGDVANEAESRSRVVDPPAHFPVQSDQVGAD